MEDLLKTDESNEAVQVLDMVRDQLRKVIDDPYYWKWVIMALHNALQGFMVLALRGSTNVNVLGRECTRCYRAAVKIGCAGALYPQLDSMLSLYDKIKSGKMMMMYVGSQAFKPSGTQTRSVKKLNRLRNDFIHFLPKTFALEVSGLPHLVDDCLGIIEFLALDSRNIPFISRHKDLEAKTKELLSELREETGKLESAYGG